MLFTTDIRAKDKQIESNSMAKIFHANSNKRKSGMASVISDKIGFALKKKKKLEEKVIVEISFNAAKR